MPAATNKSDLSIVALKEFAKLDAQLDTVPEGLRLRPDGDDTSLKDVIGHRAHWIDLFLNWYADGQDGKPVHFPAEGYKWSDLKRYNADVRKAQEGLDWDDARAMLNDNHARLMAWIDAHSDADLYGAPMKGARNKWTPGRWAEASGPSHYRSATKYIRAQTKAFKRELLEQF